MELPKTLELPSEGPLAPSPVLTLQGNHRALEIQGGKAYTREPAGIQRPGAVLSPPSVVLTSIPFGEPLLCRCVLGTFTFVASLSYFPDM